MAEPRADPQALLTAPLAATSFRPPAATVGAVRRERLLVGLADPEAPPITALIAPPGYGKTTLLATWTALETRPVAWLTLTKLENDPVRLLGYLVAAYRHVGPVDPALGSTLASSPVRLLADPLPRLLASIAAWEQPAILVLDDVHRLEDQGALDVLSVLLDRLPLGFRVALAGRSAPGLPFGRLRAQRVLREIGAKQLALDTVEAAELARRAGANLSTHAVRDLTIRTEGWAAGIYLAILACGDGDEPSIGSVSGSDQYIADYLRSEVGRGLANDDVVFLTRTSILDTVSPGGALAVSGLDRSAERLARLAASNLLIQPVTGLPNTYRYHNILREFLRAELDRREPAAATVLHRKAAAYYAANGDYERAVEHGISSRDLHTVARHLSAGAVPLYQRGQGTLLMRWIDGFSIRDFEAAPELAVLAAYLYLLEGRAERADTLADIAERTDPASLGPDGEEFRTLQAVLRATMGRHGFADMVACATRMLRDEDADAQWRSVAGALLGVAHLASANPDVDAADAIAAETLRLARPAAAGVRMTALATRAMIRLHLNDLDAAAAFAARAREELAGVSDSTVTALIVYAADARIRALRGDHAGARETLVRAQLVRPYATHVSPWQSVPALLELARAYLVLSDPAGAQTAVRQAEDIVRKRPAMGGFVDQLISLRRKLQDATSVLAGSSTLTTAELRVLPLLPTYLSFEEIGERLNVSRNTVKTHAMSIYGKLWASSRGEAVERAVELGLLEPYPVLERSSRPDNA